MPLILRWRAATSAPVGGEAIRPGGLGSVEAASRLSIPVGNSTADLAELFDLEGNDDNHLIFEGDLRTVHGLGAGMASGRLEVRGDVGHRLGEAMAGGSIEVVGSVGSNAGADLAGGFLRVRGNAGPNLGAARPGSRVGMRGGVILVDGNAGAGAGTAVRRGTIAVAGSVGEGAGRGMVAGSIFIGGKVAPGLGSGMKRGTIAILGTEPFEPGPTFEPSGTLRPPVLTIYLRQLKEWGFPVPEAAFQASIRRYNGDRSLGGQGEIFLATDGTRIRE